MESLSDHLKKSWNAYKRNFSPYFQSVVLIFLVFLVVSSIGILLFALGSPQLFYLDHYEVLADESYWDSLGLFDYMMLFGFSFLAILLAVGLAAGIYGMCFEGLRGRATLGTFFTVARRRGFRFVLAYLLVECISLLLLGITYVIVTHFGQFLILLTLDELSLVVYLYLFFNLVFFFPFMVMVPVAVVHSGKVWDSFRTSLRLGKNNYSDLLAAGIIAFTAGLLLEYLGIVGIVLGVLVFVPVFVFFLVSFFLDRAGVKSSIFSLEENASCFRPPTRKRPQYKFQNPRVSSKTDRRRKKK